MNRLALSFIIIFVLPLTAESATLATNAFPERVPASIASIITEASAHYRIDANLIASVVCKESRFNTFAVSRRGAQGLMQLMPRTARALGVTDSFDARQNVFAGTKYLSQLINRFNGDVEMALAAYNLGPERVKKEGRRATPGVVDYVADIISYHRAALRAL